MAAGVVILAAGLWLLWPFWQLAGQFGAEPARQPSRLYGRAPLLAVGELHPAAEILAHLKDLGYREALPKDGGVLPGTWHRSDAGLVVGMRSYPSVNGPTGDVRLELDFRGKRLQSLRWNGREAQRARLEPPLVSSFYGSEMKERWPVKLEAVPAHLVQAILAVEDDRFFRHQGLSVTGIVRAAWVNLRGGEVRQGGSTLTQQLVKNLYLSHERTVSRKIREAVLAVLLEARFEKEAILQAYLNEIYLGRSGRVNLIGIGAAARAFYGKRVEELDLAEAATLAGIIRSPASYDPLRHPERARERRNQVLARVAELGWIEPEQIRAAQEQELGAIAPDAGVRRALSSRQAPYFTNFVREEAARRYGISDLNDGGYTLLSTLDVRDQRSAEASVAWGLASLEKGWQKNHKGPAPLQAALVSLDPGGGGILAYVGGRDFGASQFDRASQARRQAGSAFKPVVYAAAFERGVASPSTLVDDSPLTVRLAGRTWSPQNDDDTFEGWLPVRAAVEESRNVPTARLALQVGLPRVVDLARAMGVEERLEPLPALALGAFEVTPLEMASLYATLAAEGRRPPLHSLDAIFDRQGQALQGEPLPRNEQVLSAEASYLMTSVLQGVFVRGTARRSRVDGLEDPLAGKTGTSNDRRDSWFAGYSPNRTTAVWVGYDDNASTRLSGSRAALPIWSRFTLAVRPAAGYRGFSPPAGVVTATIDPASGELATDSCPQAVIEVFRSGLEPKSVCYLHDRWWRHDRRLDRREARYSPDGEYNDIPVRGGEGYREPVEGSGDERKRHPFRKWLKRRFKQGDGG